MIKDENPRRYEKGAWVLYVPRHAHGDRQHPDCQQGVVVRQSDDGQTVFVLYDNAACTMISGDEPYTAQATGVDDLRLMGLTRR